MKKPKFWLTLLLIITFVSCGKMVLYGPNATKIINNRHFNWQEVSTPYLNIYYEPGSYAHKNISGLKDMCQKSYSHALSLLGEKSYDNTINIFIVDSREKMKRIVGWETNGSAFPGKNLVCFVYSEKINASGAHEIMHILSINLWGSSDKWIQEGLAVYADDNWYGYDLHALCKFLLLNNALLSLEDLTSNFNDFNDLVTYPQAGSLVKFLYEKYGLKLVKRMWQEDVRIFTEITYKDLSALEQEWHKSLMNHNINNIKYRI